MPDTARSQVTRAPTPLAGALAGSFREWETHALVDRWVYRPIDQAIVRLLRETRISPNHVSLGSAVAGLIAGICFFGFTRASIALGGLFVFLSVVLDGVDGQLARARGASSESGKLFDNLADPTKTLFIMFGIAFGMDRADTWGNLGVLPGLPMNVRIYGLGWLAGAAMLLQVLSRNWFVEQYRRHGKGRSDPSIANLAKVREELDVMQRAGGHLIERVVLGLVLALSRRKPPRPVPLMAATPGYADRMLPFVRTWTFFGGGTQFTVLAATSLLGQPVWAWLYVGVISNVVYVPLLIATRRAHHAALARG